MLQGSGKIRQYDTLIREHEEGEDAEAENDKWRKMRVTFEKHLAFLTATIHDAISDRDRLLKHSKGYQILMQIKLTEFLRGI